MILLVSLVNIVLSATSLKGNVSDVKFDKTGNPFIVENQIYIPENKSIEIREGCVFLFKEYTGFEIQGNLIVTGTVKDPVVFTTINDDQFNSKSEKKAEPFNWNGITITKKAKRVILTNITVCYSVFGIKSDMENISILHGLFYENGQYDVTINEKLQKVNRLVPFNYGTIAAFAKNDKKGINIAVVDLTSTTNDFSESEIKTITERLRGEMVETGKYNVLERKEMTEILKEQQFQYSGACEDECIVEIGQLLAVQNIIGGTIGKVGKTYSIQLKVIDVGTAKIINQISEDAKCTKEELLIFHIRNIARRMAGLEKIKEPLTKKWYFWAPAIAVVGGGAAAAAYLYSTREGEPPGEDTRSLQVEVPIQ